MQQQWLVLTPVRRDPQARMQITVHTAVADPADSGPARTASSYRAARE
jgi:hypothetical protein